MAANTQDTEKAVIMKTPTRSMASEWLPKLTTRFDSFHPFRRRSRASNLHLLFHPGPVVRAPFVLFWWDTGRLSACYRETLCNLVSRLLDRVSRKVSIPSRGRGSSSSTTLQACGSPDRGYGTKIRAARRRRLSSPSEWALSIKQPYREIGRDGRLDTPTISAVDTTLPGVQNANLTTPKSSQGL